MKKSQMARIVEFDRQLRQGRYPNRSNFGVDYGVSARTVARDVEYLRDRLEAPLEYDADRRGYYYSKPWNLPAVVVGSGLREDWLASLIEQLKTLKAAERDYVISSVTQAVACAQVGKEMDFAKFAA